MTALGAFTFQGISYIVIRVFNNIHSDFCSPGKAPNVIVRLVADVYHHRYRMIHRPSDMLVTVGNIEDTVQPMRVMLNQTIYNINNYYIQFYLI